MEQTNGIVNKNGYTFWNNVSVVDDYIFEFIRNKFPDSLILPEFNKVDWTVIDKNLPIEIQSTIVNSKGMTISHSQFEGHIRQQLEQNIKTSGRCWFFFDAEYLRYLQSVAGGCISINFDWFYRLMKDEKLKVFTVTYDGKIEEKSRKDFEFIKKLSSTCELGVNEDSRVLEQNLLKITTSVFNYYGITTEEMKKLRRRFNERNRDDTKYHFRDWLRRDNSNDREKMICDIYRSLFSLNMINIGFDCKVPNDKNVSNTTVRFSQLGLTDRLYGRNQDVIKRFVDLPNIAQYFPGYIRNKEKWDYLKESKTNLNSSRFNAVVTGKANPLEWKKLIYNGW